MAYSLFTVFVTIDVDIILFVNSASLYHPSNVYPTFVGVGSSPYSWSNILVIWSLSSVPPFNSNSITFVFVFENSILHFTFPVIFDTVNPHSFVSHFPVAFSHSTFVAVYPIPFSGGTSCDSSSYTYAIVIKSSICLFGLVITTTFDLYILSALCSLLEFSSTHSLNK